MWVQARDGLIYYDAVLYGDGWLAEFKEDLEFSIAGTGAECRHSLGDKILDSGIGLKRTRKPRRGKRAFWTGERWEILDCTTWEMVPDGKIPVPTLHRGRTTPTAGLGAKIFEHQFRRADILAGLAGEPSALLCEALLKRGNATYASRNAIAQVKKVLRRMFPDPDQVREYENVEWS